MGYINDQGEYVNNSRSKIKDKKSSENTISDTPKLSLISIFLPFAAVIVPIYLYFTGSSATESFIVFTILGVSIYINDLISNKTGMAIVLFICIGIFLGINNGGGSIVGGIIIGAVIGVVVEILNKFKF